MADWLVGWVVGGLAGEGGLLVDGWLMVEWVGYLVGKNTAVMLLWRHATACNLWYQDVRNLFTNSGTSEDLLHHWWSLVAVHLGMSKSITRYLPSP